MDYSAEVEKAKKLLNDGNFNLCSVQCGRILEGILKITLKNLCGHPKCSHIKSIIRQSYPDDEKFTLGKILIIFRKNNLFNLLSEVYDIDKKKVNAIDFDVMLRIRNNAIHEVGDDLEDGTDADTYIIYGYLLKLIKIINPVLNIPQKVLSIKSLPVLKPQFAQKNLTETDLKPTTVVHRPVKRTIISTISINNNDESIHKDTIDVCKNKRTGKFFIFLEKVSAYEAHYIIPDGKIKALSSDLFHEIEVHEKKYLLTKNLITLEQSKQLKFYEEELPNNGIDHPILERDLSGEPGYIKKYRKMLESPNTIPSIMLRCIKSAGTIRWKDLKKILIERYNYRGGGSFGASLRVLEIDRHIKIDGSGDDKLIS